jgi:hypothetical protein
MNDALFDTEPVPGERWSKPEGEALVVLKVWKHQLYEGQVWIRAARKGGDWYSTSGPLDTFLERGYRKVA